MTPHSRPSTRNRGFRQAGGLIEKRMRPACENRGFAVTRLLTQWAETVGSDLAKLTRPIKIGYGRSGLGATLTILAKGAAAPMVEARKDELRNRVNACYGYNAISRVRITQTSETGFAEAQTPFRAAPRKPSPEAREAAHTLTQEITDPELRAALADIGGHILDRSHR